MTILFTLRIFARNSLRRSRQRNLFSMYFILLEMSDPGFKSWPYILNYIRSKNTSCIYIYFTVHIICWSHMTCPTQMTCFYNKLNSCDMLIWHAQVTCSTFVNTRAVRISLMFLKIVALVKVNWTRKSNRLPSRSSLASVWI